MKIDEDARVAAVDALMARGFAWTHSTDLVQWVLNAYLAALPSAEPGRDRIAVVVDQSGSGVAQWLATEGRPDWRHLESFMKDSKSTDRAIIRCNLPRPAEPVEVEGSVEGVG